MKQVIITVPESFVEDVKAMYPEKPFEQVVAQLASNGFKAAAYRRERNVKQWAQTKVLKSKLSELRQIAQEKGLSLAELGLE